jgi:2,4-diketo-3-deoxy-L-fuconate hydrolase
MSFTLANLAGRATLIDGDDCYDLETVSGGALGSDLMAAIADHGQLHALAADLVNHDAVAQRSAVELGPPVPNPRNSLAVGLNYGDHVAESGMEQPDTPLMFAKFPACITGPTADVELRSDFADYEAEVVVVIGTGGRDIEVEQAWDHVAGLTAGQDISDRVLQFAAKPPHFDLGKSRDTYGPIGPVLVSTDQFADPDDIALSCHVNGDERQRSSTASLLFSIPELISYVSGILTLSPGDIIFTGTPDGVGATTGTFLTKGDVILTEVAGVGQLTNRCV